MSETLKMKQAAESEQAFPSFWKAQGELVLYYVQMTKIGIWFMILLLPILGVGIDFLFAGTRGQAEDLLERIPNEFTFLKVIYHSQLVISIIFGSFNLYLGYPMWIKNEIKYSSTMGRYMDVLTLFAMISAFLFVAPFVFTFSIDDEMVHFWFGMGFVITEVLIGRIMISMVSIVYDLQNEQIRSALEIESIMMDMDDEDSDSDDEGTDAEAKKN